MKPLCPCGNPAREIPPNMIAARERLNVDRVARGLKPFATTPRCSVCALKNIYAALGPDTDPEINASGGAS